MLYVTAFCQIKVIYNGNVGIGTYNPISRLNVAGDFYITNYYNSNRLRMLSYNPGVEIGSSTDKIEFWYTNTGYNKLYAQAFYQSSDTTVKENITRIENAMRYLSRINGYSYNYKDDTGSNRKREYGVLAQELMVDLPELVDTSKGLMLVNYSSIIPFLLEGLKSHQNLIDSLHHLTEDLQNRIFLIEHGIPENENKDTYLSSKQIIQQKGVLGFLYQNAPNPFSKMTKIKYFIEKETNKAEIKIFSFDGLEIKKYFINNTGLGEITINGNEFLPGSYIYVLNVNDIPIDSKVMILSK